MASSESLLTAETELRDLLVDELYALGFIRNVLNRRLVPDGVIKSPIAVTIRIIIVSHGIARAMMDDAIVGGVTPTLLH